MATLCREKEKVLLANLDSLMAKAGENYWEAVTGFINFDTQQDKKGKGKSATPRQSIVPEVKAGRQTDLARFRQVSFAQRTRLQLHMELFLAQLIVKSASHHT